MVCQSCERVALKNQVSEEDFLTKGLSSISSNADRMSMSDCNHWRRDTRSYPSIFKRFSGYATVAWVLNNWRRFWEKLGMNAIGIVWLKQCWYNWIKMMDPAATRARTVFRMQVVLEAHGPFLWRQEEEALPMMRKLMMKANGMMHSPNPLENHDEDVGEGTREVLCSVQGLWPLWHQQLDLGACHWCDDAGAAEATIPWSIQVLSAQSCGKPDCATSASKFCCHRYRCIAWMWGCPGSRCFHQEVQAGGL